MNSTPTQRECYLQEQISTARSRIRRSTRIVEIRAYEDLLSRLERELANEHLKRQQQEITDANES